MSNGWEPDERRLAHDLGRQLLSLRRQRNVTASELSRRSGISRSKISKLENGHVRVTDTTLRRLTKALGLPEDEQERLLAYHLARQPLGALALDKISEADKLIALHEQSRTTLQHVRSGIPALLQTPAYVRAVTDLCGCDIRLVQARRHRAQAMLWDSTKEFQIVFYESALSEAPLTNLDEFEIQAQFSYILTISKLTNVDIRIIPRHVSGSSTAHPDVAILARNDVSILDDLVIIDLVHETVFRDAPSAVLMYRDTYEQVFQAAPSSDATNALLEKLLMRASNDKSVVDLREAVDNQSSTLTSRVD